VGSICLIGSGLLGIVAIRKLTGLLYLHAVLNVYILALFSFSIAAMRLSQVLPRRYVWPWLVDTLADDGMSARRTTSAGCQELAC
jgi:hypothetical protein